MSRDYQFQIVMRDLSQFSQIYLIPIADLHQGCRDADYEVSDGYINWIKEHDNAFTVLNGDLMNCLDQETELLTEAGWLKYKEVVRHKQRNRNFKIMGYDKDTQELSWQRLENFITKEYKGDIIRFTSRKMDIVVTPEHRILGQFITSYGAYTDFQVREAGSLKKFHQGTMRIPVCGKWNGDKTLDDSRIKLAAWIIAKGWKSDYRLAVSQSEKSSHVTEIEELLKVVKLFDKRINKDGVISWRFTDAILCSLFRTSRWHKNTKRIPRLLKELSTPKLLMFIEEMLKGDGHLYKSGTKTLFSCSPELVGDFQEICIKAGLAINTTFRTNERKGLYSIFINQNSYFVPSFITRQAYEGIVYCPTVKTGFVVVRRNNKVAIVGNCAWKDSTPDLFEDLTTPDDAYDKLKARLEPIKSRIIMMTRGGHEESIFRKVGHDYMAQLAHDLGDIPYRPDGGMFGIRLSKNNHHAIVTGYAVHGWGGARTIGAKVKKAQDLAQVADVDIYILSHDHTQNINRMNILVPPRSHVSCEHPIYMSVNRKLFINTGGFVKYSGYIRRKGYTPQDLGTPRIRIEFKTDKAEKKGFSDYHLDLHASI